MAEEQETLPVQTVHVVKCDLPRLENFDSFFQTVKGKLIVPDEDLTSTLATLEKRYETLVGAAMALNVRSGTYTDENTLVIMKNHVLTRFPLVHGEEWDKWFMSMIQNAYENVILDLPDKALVETSRVTYRYKTSSFYITYIDEPEIE